MPRTTIRGVDLYYEELGSGSQTIVFAHGLLGNGRMFEEQMAGLSGRFRCIAFDFRGHGASEVTRSGYDMDSLTADTLVLLEELGCTPCHFVGHSTGGFVGMRLAIRHPKALRSLTLLNTTADPEPAANLPRYRLLSFLGRWLGLEAVVGRLMTILFGSTFLADPSRSALRERWRRVIVANDRRGFTRVVEGALRRKGVYEQIDRIGVPTLILAGEEDVATPPEMSERIQSRIPGSVLRRIPGAGHSAAIEEPAAVTSAIGSFLRKLYKARREEFQRVTDPIVPLVPGRGSCMATDRIVVDGYPVGYMSREIPVFPKDSGWRFFAGDEDEEYLAEPSNRGLFTVNTVANCDPTIIPWLSAPFGSRLVRLNDSQFRMLAVEDAGQASEPWERGAERTASEVPGYG